MSVLVVVPFGDGEHLGFIINRPLELSLGSMFPEHAPSRKVIDPVHFGGPVMVDTMFAVLRAPRNPGGESLPLFADLFVASRADDIDRIIEQTPDDARFSAALTRGIACSAMSCSERLPSVTPPMPCPA